VGKHDRARQVSDDNIIGLLRFADCIIKVIDTHSEYIITIDPHGNNEHANAPQCYLTLPALLNSKTGGT
jgi:hypothetical protein